MMLWQFKGTPNPLPGQATGTIIRTSVAVSQDGTIAVQGFPNLSGGNGQVLIHKYNGTTWGTPFTLNEPGAGGSRYGRSVSLTDDGTILAVGAPYMNSNVGIVYLYKQITGSWTLLTTINRPASADCLFFGHSISLRKSSTMCYIAIGTYSTEATPYWGSVYTFTYNIDTYTLNQLSPVLHGNPPESPVSDTFGWSVSMSSDFQKLVVGAPDTEKGSAFVFSWDSLTSQWNTSPEQIWFGNNIGDNFGTSVSISQDGTKVVIGAAVSTGAALPGYVNLYTFNGTWQQNALTNNTGITNANLGISICMALDGNMFVAGTSGHLIQGYAIVYKLNSTTGTWSNTQITNPGTSGDGFGYSVALASADSGNTLIIGATGSINGQSYAYHYVSPSLCLTEGTRILTPVGYRPVEQLEKFDYVTTADGRNVMIKHVHHSQHYYVGELEAPFYVPAHALAMNVPSHDIKLSPDHLVHVGDDLWLTPRGMAKRSDKVVQYDIGKTIHYYAIMTPNYFQDNLVIEDGVVVEAYGARDLVYDEEKKAYHRKAKEDK